MDKIIPFNKGIRRQPSLGEDGELSELVNLIPKNGELVNVKAEVKVEGIVLGEGDTYIGSIKSDTDNNAYVAVNGKIIKYIVVGKDYALEINFTDSNLVKTFSASGTVSNVRIFGKCVCYYSPYAQYLLLRGTEFVPFSEMLNDLQITFGLQASTETTSEEDKLTVLTTDGAFTSSEAIIVEKFGERITNYVSSIEKKGWFVNPFMVRYAYRMFDGNLKCQSVPVLMPCCNKYGAVALDLTTSGSVGGELTVKVKYKCYKHKLFYNVRCNGQILSSLKNSLSDIVQSIDIYVCPIKMARNTTGKFVTRISDYFSFSSYNIQNNIFSKLSLSNSIDDIQRAAYAFYDDDKMKQEIEECATFHLLKSIKIQDITRDTYTLVDTTDVNIAELQTKELMTDGYNDYARVSAEMSYMYNGRMIRGDIGKSVFYESPLFKNIGCSYHKNDNGTQYNLMLLADKKGEQVALSCGTTNMMATPYSPYIFIQDPDVTTVYIGKGGNYKKLEMKRHEYLYGAYCYNDMSNLLDVFDSSLGGTFETRYDESQHNVLQVSEPNSPFTYLPKNELVVGDGSIIGMSTSAKALSQGQFGQFPLYVFCTDGIWALEVASDGTFSAKQPLSRDVCNNPDSITQIDGAVVFTTDQGLKMVQGSDVVLLSGNMDGHNVKENYYFPKGYFAKKDAQKYNDFDNLVIEEYRDFREILRNCRIAYDYPNNMLRIYPKTDNGKYYVFDLGTREFSSCIGSAVDAVVADYPTSIVQIGTNLYTFSNTVGDGHKNGLLLTRPISLDNPSALKKLQELKLHYSKLNDDSYCRVCMFVSNNGKDWVEKTSLRGGSYKYFRFGVITHMTDDEALSGMVVRYETNRTNKLR